MVAVIQPNFAAGEVSLPVQARVDLNKRTVAVERAYNMMVSVTGSLVSRPGTEYIAGTYDGDASRLIPFEYNTDQTYVLEFADNRIVVYRDGVEKDSISSPYDITDIWDLRVAQYGNLMTITHEDYAPRELLRVSDTSWSIDTISFSPEQAAPSSVRVSTNEQEGAAIGITSVTQANPPLVTSSAAHDLADNDLIYTRYNNNVDELNRGFWKVNVKSATTFELLDPEDGSDVDGTGWAAYSAGNFAEAPNPRKYMVTAVNASTGEESLAGASAYEADVSSVNSATPAEVTLDINSGFGTGDTVTFSSTGSILDGEYFTLTKTGELTHTLQWLNGEDVDGSDVFESGGYMHFVSHMAPLSKDTKWDNNVRWSKADDAVIYNVYASDGGAYGLIGSTTGKNFRDYFIAPDTSIAPPTAHNPFFDPSGGADRYPRACAYHDQRRVFGYSNDYPNRLWLTQIGNFYNLTWSTPAQDDDAIVASIATAKINDVEHLLSLSELIALTGGAEIRVSGGDAVLSPSTISTQAQSFYGSGTMPPLVAGDVGLLSLDGNVIRDFEYTISSQSFVGVDLTILARHLLDNYTLQDWTYAHTPHAVAPIARTDGVAPVFTYFPEQEVYGWTRWVTQGDWHSFCAIKEDGIDKIYAVVNRDGTYMIERFEKRRVEDPYDYHGVDSGVFHDATAKTVTGAALDGDDYVVITSASHGFSDGDIVDICGILEKGADRVEVLSDDWNGDGFTVADKTTNTFKIKFDGSYIDGSGFTAYSSAGEAREAVTTVGGLSHLNGETVVAAANGRDAGEFTVAGGEITLSSPASRIHVGLPYTCEVITLPVSAYGTGGTIEGEMKNINRFALHVISTADFYAGPDRSGLQKHAAPTPRGHRRQCMMNKSNRVTIRGTWDRNRSMMVQQRSPLPMELASIIPDVLIGED